MKVLFLTIGRMASIEDSGIYTDLLKCFRDNGHEVFAVSAREKRLGLTTECRVESGIHMLRVKVGNITKCGLLEKGFSMLTIGGNYKRAIERYFPNVKFDLVIYSTPPITLAGVIRYIKHRDNARTYLLLKDIFPQNAVDLGMMSKLGVKAPIYWYFRHKEKQLYDISDNIGCMSQANVEYVLRNNPKVDPKRIGVCPNSIKVIDMRANLEERDAIRSKYGIPLNKTVFVYGGNLGKPQGIPFLIDCLRAESTNPNAFFLVVGDGTEYRILENYVNTEKPKNIRLEKRLPKGDYDRLVAACDVGMIFLDHRFTIPNFPSRLLSYMQSGLPVLACTDSSTDIGKTIVDGGFGWWCESSDLSCFTEAVDSIMAEEFQEFEKNSWEYLNNNFNIERAYLTIIKSANCG